MTIRLRLTLLFTLATLLLVTVGGYLFVTRLSAGVRAALDTTLSSRGTQLARELASTGLPTPGPPSVPGDRLLLNTVNGVSAQILTARGGLIVGSRGLGRAALLTPAQAAVAARRSISLDVTISSPFKSDPGQEPLRVLARPGAAAGRVVAVAISRDAVEKTVTRAKNQLVLLAVIALGLAAGGAWLLTGAALRPVERMRLAVAAAASEDDTPDLIVPATRDEISRLAQTFNLMIGRMRAAVEREQAFVADAGHELRSPLTVLQGELELARRPGRDIAELRQAVDIAAEETERLARLTEDLLRLSVEAQDGPAQHVGFDLCALLRLSAQAARVIADPMLVDVVVHVDRAAGSVATSGNPDRIRQAVDNLLANAIRFSPSLGTVTVRGSRAGAATTITVLDQGPGFPVDFVDHAFERFSRADNSRERPGDGYTGYGLGLAMVQSVMRRHGGSAIARNEPGGGAMVTMTWPVEVAPAPSPADAHACRQTR